MLIGEIGIGIRVFLIVSATALLGYAAVLLEDPSSIYKRSRLDRHFLGWLEGHWLLRPFTLYLSILLAIVGVGVYLYALIP